MDCDLCDNEPSDAAFTSDLRRLYDLIAEQRTMEALTMLHESYPSDLPTPATILRLRQHQSAGTDL